FADITFSYLTDEKLYEKAFCVKPPDDICPFNLPCPNTDVTGVGQQISIYITAVIYAIVLVYIANLRRPMLYAHLSLLYSLLIAAMVSAHNGELSRPDGIFVITTVASPASLYLWYCTLRSIRNVNNFPMDPANVNKPKGRSIEVKAAQVLSLGSLILEIAMICVVFIPRVKGIKFPQSACDRSYGTTFKWSNVVWWITIAIQILVFVFSYFLVLFSTKCWTKRKLYEIPAFREPLELLGGAMDSNVGGTIVKENVDLISWTERVLLDRFPNFMDPALLRCIVFIAQWSVLPNLALPIFTMNTDVVIVLLAFGLFRQPPERGPNRIRRIFTRIAVFILFLVAGVGGGIAPYLEFVWPSPAGWVIALIGFSAASWSRSHFSVSNMKTFLPVVILLTTFVLSLSSAVVPYTADAVMFSNPIAWQRDVYSVSIFYLSDLSPAIWIICWQATSVWPWRRIGSQEMLSEGCWKRAHFLKMFCAVLLPHMLWIQASSSSNPWHSTEMTFGQIFAMIVSLAGIITLVEKARNVRKHVWLAILYSDVITSEPGAGPSILPVSHRPSSLAPASPPASPSPLRPRFAPYVNRGRRATSG
ncbi:hypothetical protein DFP72DRAFT_1107630, partial [Ephemerocybe angulata]